METFSTEALVLLCREHLPDDTRAFEQLVTRFQRRVFSVAYRLVGHQQEAEDLAQEVFLKVYRSIKRLEDPGHFSAWVTRITVNTCLDELSKRQRRPQTTPLSPSAPDEESNLPDRRQPTPEEAALQREFQRCLSETLRNLDPNTRTALVLRDIEDRPYQEIADTLEIGMSAVKMRIHRARLAFQQVLTRICPDLLRQH